MPDLEEKHNLLCIFHQGFVVNTNVVYSDGFTITKCSCTKMYLTSLIQIGIERCDYAMLI